MTNATEIARDPATSPAQRRAARGGPPQLPPVIVADGDRVAPIARAEADLRAKRLYAAQSRAAIDDDRARCAAVIDLAEQVDRGLIHSICDHAELAATVAADWAAAALAAPRGHETDRRRAHDLIRLAQRLCTCARIPPPAATAPTGERV